MGAFSRVEQTAGAQKPAHTCIVPLSAFSDTWKGRPTTPVCAGFRPLSLDDVSSVRATASAESFRLHPRPEDDENRADAFADALMRLCIARSVCDPNDVSKPWAVLGRAADDNVGICLSTEGARMLYRQIDYATVLASPMYEGTDEELLELFDLLPIALPRMPDDRAKAVRKWLAFLLEQCRAHVAADDPELVGEQDDEDVTNEDG